MLIDRIIYWHSLQARRNELGSLFRKDIASIDLNQLYLLAVLPPLESWVSAVELSPVWFLIMPCVHGVLGNLPSWAPDGWEVETDSDSACFVWESSSLLN